MSNEFLERIRYNKEIKNCDKYESRKSTSINFENSQFSKALESITGSEFYQKENPKLGNQHKIGHIQKVMLFSQLIAQNEDLDDKKIKLLLAAAAFHDCGREKDRDNGEHGEFSAQIAGKYFNENQDNPYGIMKDEIGAVQSAILYHVAEESIPGQIDDIKLAEICNKFHTNLEDYEAIKQISTILKDADALDRTRFVSNSNLNPKFLRTKTAKQQQMIEISKKINQEYAKMVLKYNYNIKEEAEKDEIEILHIVRHNYKEKNNWKDKKERNIPLNIIKTTFKEVLKEIDIDFKQR